MEKREAGIQEIIKRLNPLYNSLKLKTIMRAPSRSIDENDIPCILVMEGDDSIFKRIQRNNLGYPCKRSLQIVVECWDYATPGDVRNIIEEARKRVLESNGVLVKGITILEQKMVGPYNMAIPKLLGMRIIFEMYYDDIGPYNGG